MKQQIAVAENIRSKLGISWIPSIYRDKIRAQRTRAFHLDIPAKENKPEILHTLLGVELKVGNRRFACPDLATARYMQVFARVGCRDFAVPYDITKISTVADELETSWHQMLLLLGQKTEGQTVSTVGRSRSALIRALREEIEEIGPGDAMPAFDRPTRQRSK
jgi:hypothetical protein